MKVFFGMALRQTTGFVESLLRLVGLDWSVPDFSTLSRHQKTLAVSIPYLQGELELVRVKQHRGEARGAMTWPEPLAWFQGANQVLTASDPLPLVAFPWDGLYRRQMTTVLDSIERIWRLVYTSSSLVGLLSAIDAGLGGRSLPGRLVGHKLHEVPTLPDVDAMEIAIYQSDPDIPFASEIVRILAEAIEE